MIAAYWWLLPAAVLAAGAGFSLARCCKSAVFGDCLTAGIDLTAFAIQTAVAVGLVVLGNPS